MSYKKNIENLSDLIYELQCKLEELGDLKILASTTEGNFKFKNDFVTFDGSIVIDIDDCD